MHLFWPKIKVLCELKLKSSFCSTAYFTYRQTFCFKSLFWTHGTPKKNTVVILKLKKLIKKNHTTLYYSVIEKVKLYSKTTEIIIIQLNKFRNLHSELGLT